MNISEQDAERFYQECADKVWSQVACVKASSGEDRKKFCEDICVLADVIGESKQKLLDLYARSEVKIQIVKVVQLMLARGEI